MPAVLLLSAAMRSVLGTSLSPVAFVLLVTLTSAVLRADDNTPGVTQPVADGEVGILLLEDGGVLTGQITRAADWYIVSRGGGQMQVAAKRVTLVCRTLGEAYECRRQKIDGTKVADHLRLAEWCIRYELREEAGRELAEARRIDPDQMRLALLERRQEKMGDHPVVKQEKEKESVYLASVNSRAKPQAAGGGVQEKKLVEATAGDLPNGVVEVFTRKVQPVLVNSCSMAGCHQLGGKQAFQLDRALLRGEANRRTTMHNLQASLALVDRAHPDQSPLLTVPRKTHGGTNGPVFGPRQQQAFNHLVDWVAIVVPPAEAPVPTPVVDATVTPASVSAANANADVAVTPAQDIAQLPPRRRSEVRAAAITEGDTLTTLRTPHRLQVGVQARSWRPRDAFDPEIFNRGQQARTQTDVSAGPTASAAAAVTAEQR